MKPPYRIFVFTLSPMIIVILLSLILIKFEGPRLLLTYLQQELRDSCASCKLDARSLQLALFPSPQIIANNLTFYINESPDSEVSLSIEEAHFNFHILPLFQKEIIIDSANFESPRVLLTQSDQESKKKQHPKSDSIWSFSVQKTSIRRASFEYLRITHGTSSALHIHQISLDAGELNSERQIDKVLSAHANACIESSGEVELQTKIKSLRAPVSLEFEVKAHGQKLSDLSRFFKPNAGVILNGSLIKGRGIVLLNGDNLESTVWAEYKDLNVELIKTYDRSEASAFFTNLAEAVMIAKKNQGKPRDKQTSSTHLTRNADEPVIAFILRGLKEAALKVAEEI